MQCGMHIHCWYILIHAHWESDNKYWSNKNENSSDTLNPLKASPGHYHTLHHLSHNHFQLFNTYMYDKIFYLKKVKISMPSQEQNVTKIYINIQGERR